MKHLIVSVGIMLTAGWSIAQTDQINLQKYWKLRNDFREKFVRIGPAAGESLPAGALLPNDCVDTYDVSQDGTPYSGTKYSEMRWGDGMIRHGHYLGLLATEYRLLKNAGEDVTGVLNELYYAINAVNRLDLRCEPEQDFFYGLTLSENLNGYFLREDIPEDFAKEHWLQSEMRMGCTNSSFYKNNNIGKLNVSTEWGTYYSEGNTYQNVPSQDQFSSLIVGFSLVHKLVDDVFVQPSMSENGFYIVTEVKNIVDRMMTFVESHNWQLIEVNGWPVNNGSGDFALSAYPLSQAALRITGNMYDNPIVRRSNGINMKNIAFCITGFGLHSQDPADRQEACNDIDLLDFGQELAYTQLQPGVPADALNNQNTSVYQSWQATGLLNSLIYFSVPLWSQNTTAEVLNMIDDYNDDQKINLLPAPFKYIHWSDKNLNHYSFTVFNNTGVASGLWTNTAAKAWADSKGNRALELINAIIRDELPAGEKSFYGGFLNSMDASGPYRLEGRAGSGDNLRISSKGAENGWSTDYRWSSDPADPQYGELGIFNGLDYMLYHNLYYLLYEDQLPPFKQDDYCFCNSVPSYSSPVNTAEEFYSQEALNQKLQYVPACVDNVFDPTFNLVNATFDVRPFFANYTQMGIYTTKFQTENATITGTGDINILTRFKICNTKTLTIQAGGRMDIEKAGVWLNNYAQIDNSGDIRIKAGTTLTVGQLGKLILRNGSKLTIEEGATLILEEGAELQYYSGAVIYMNGPGSIIKLGGSIKVMNSAEFTITHLGTSAGKIIVNGTSAGLLTATANVGKFKLVGKGISDPLIILEPNAKLWAMDTYAQSLTIQQCKVVFGAGASLRCDQPFYTGSVEFTSTSTNGGVTTTELAVINSSRFINCPIFAKMNIENKGTFGCYNSYLLADSPTLNPNDKALIDIVGRGYDISTCDFHTTKNYAVKSNNMTLASTIAGGSIQYYGTLPVGHQLTGIYDYSTVEVSVKNMIINKCYTGIHKRNGKLTLRCNVISNNQDLNVIAGEYSLLNMNSQKLGGYNTLLKTTNNKNISLVAANIDIMYGYNFIEYTTANTTISGAINSYCTTCPGLNFMQNQWVASGKTPVGFGGIYSLAGTSYPVAVTITPVALLQVCPTSTTPGGGENQRSAVADDGMPLMYSPSAGDSVRLDELIYNASENMSFYGDSTANDLLAVDLLDEVFNADLDSTDELSNYWKWFAFEQMKTALESAFANNQLNVTDNATGFDPYVTKYVHALGEMTEPVITQENYTTQFYHEINKAHLFRMTGHPNIGLNILTELESCGLDSMEQAGLNYWKTVFEADIIANQIGLAALDSTIVVDTTGYISPALTVNAFRFGAQINDMNNILYPNCNYFITRDKKMDLNAMNLYPNPATSEVTIKFNHPLMKGEGIVTIQQADGRVVYTKIIDTNDAIGLTVQVSEWKSGAYQVRYQDPEGFVSTAQLIVK